MTGSDIAQTVLDFRNAATGAMEAGFDGVEIHSSNGYLFHQFFSSATNIRNDRYGGSVENRSRFLFEVLDSVLSQVPAERVGTRLNPMYHGRAGIFLNEDSLPTFEYIVERLNDYGLAYLHLSRPFFPVDSPLMLDDVPAHFRKIYRGHLMVNGEYDRESGEAELKAGNADSVSFGRPYISNPDLVERIRRGYPWAEPDKFTFYSPGPKGYTSYPPYHPS
jgi:N-ethylmaleimide reductase